MNSPLNIPVFAINLPNQSKRKANIREQFKNRHEFNLYVFRGKRSKTGWLGFLKSVKQIIKIAIKSDYNFIVICSDDHEFTQNYNREKFLKVVHDARTVGAKILLGGVESYGEVVPITNDLLWLDRFSYSTFYVIYKPCYRELLKLDLKNGVSLNEVINTSTSNKFLIYPFISTEAVSNNKKRGIREYPRESSNSYCQASIIRLEKILYLKKHKSG